MSIAVASKPFNQQQAGMRAAGSAATPHSQQAPSPSPFVEVTEQPKSHGLRFRYECEGRCAGSIPGESSSDSHRTYPTITIHNYSGPSSVVVVSLVTKDDIPKAHPHRLVGRECKDGVCTMKLSNTYTISFPNIGIQCVKKGAAKESLEKRKQLRVDPFSAGFGHMDNLGDVDMSIVRLCWQVFLPDPQGKFTRALKPLVSTFIYDKKTASDLVICRLSKNSGSVRGGEEVFLLCEKVHKEDIEVIVYEELPDGSTWREKCEFGPTDVHKQHAIVLKTPLYHDVCIEKPVEVKIQLYRPSDQTYSDPKQFIYIPDDPDPYAIETKRKRKKMDSLQSFYADLAPNAATSNGGDSLIPATVEPSSTSDVKQRLVRKVARNKSKASASATAASSSSGRLGSSAEVETEEEVNTLSPADGGPASAIYADVTGGTVPASNLVAMAMGMSGANEIQLQEGDLYQLIADNPQQFQYDPASGTYIFNVPQPPQFATVASVWQQPPATSKGS